MHKNTKLYLSFCFLTLALVACSGDDGMDGAPGENTVTGVLSASTVTTLKVGIDDVEINSAPVVNFHATDENDVPVAGLRAGDSGGNLRFTIATLMPGTAGGPSYWKNYIVSNNGQETYERTGVLEDHGNGQFSYTFAKDITTSPDYNASRTHRVAMQIDGFTATNPSLDFRPDGGKITLRRDIVKTEDCNSCHNKLAIHGGGRIEMKYCVTCHTPATKDPDTGNTVDFKVMIHKIHYGEEMPSVRGPDGEFEDDPGTPGIDESADNIPYQIIGYGGSVHDYSTVVFPQDIRNCTKCHNGSDPDNAPQGNNWKEKPSVEACGSCHDNIYFGNAAKGFRTVAHAGGPTSNEFCVNCHVSGGNPEWKVAAAHSNPVKVGEPKFQYNILEVCGTPVPDDPGDPEPNCAGAPVTPTVTFSVSDPTGGTHGYGSNYDVKNDPEFGAGASLNLLTAWDSSDYTNDGGAGSRPARANSYNLNSIKANAIDNLDGSFTATLVALPGAVNSGSGAVAMEGHPRVETVVGSGTFNVNVPVRGEVAYFGINGDPMVERRVAVDIVNKCDNCHDKLGLHGNNRADNAQLCVMCHNPRMTDIGRRAGVGIDGKLEETVDMKVLIHAIHAGDQDEHGFRENGIVVYGYGGSDHDYSHVRFPGILNDCTACHNSGTYELDGKWAMPLQNGILATTIETNVVNDQADDLFTTPTAAVCSACHDDALAQEHMEALGGAKFVVNQGEIDTAFETCSVCHGPGKIADLNVVHEID